MKKGDIVEGTIEKVDLSGKGILLAGEERVVAKNVLPGQRVQVRVTKRRKGRCEGQVLKVLEKAPKELEEGICPHFNQCGGCIYQSLPYEEQLKLKERQITELLSSVCPDRIEPIRTERGWVSGPEEAGCRVSGPEGSVGQSAGLGTGCQMSSPEAGCRVSGPEGSVGQPAGLGTRYQMSGPEEAGRQVSGPEGPVGQPAGLGTGCQMSSPEEAGCQMSGPEGPVGQPAGLGTGCQMSSPEEAGCQMSGPEGPVGQSAGLEWQGIKPSPIWEGYRNKMEFSFGDAYKGGPLALGMHKKGSFYDIVTTEDCRIVHPDFCRILAVTREYFAGLGVPFYRKLQHKGFLRHLLVRRAVKTGEILVDLVTTSQVDQVKTPDGSERREGKLEDWQKESVQKILQGWADRICACAKESLEGRLVGVLHTWNDSLADVVQNDRTDILFGQDFFYEELLGLCFKITPFSFFQTNSLGAEVLYATVRDYIGETRDKRIFDLYSGTGTIAQILAPVARQVTGVEIVEEAVEAARENAAMNGLGNCRFLAGDVLKVIDELEDKPDLIVLDPPRDGIHPKALPKIIRSGVERIVYVSCKPTSLVRDLAVFLENGYRVEKACAVDMFPGTGGIETVCLLSNTQRKKESYITLDVEMADYYRIKNEGKTTGK